MGYGFRRCRKRMQTSEFSEMDSQVQVEGRLLDTVDDQWRTDTLPLDDIHVTLTSLLLLPPGT